MEENKYVKGNYNEIVRRINSIHTMTIRCPISDYGVKCLRTSTVSTISSYAESESLYSCVPVVDVYNVFMYTLSFCKENKIDYSKLYVACGCIQSFKNLKYVTLEFVDDENVDKAYDNMNNNIQSEEERMKVLSSIYNIDVIEFNLSDMFTQEIIDIFNKCMIHNGLMYNSYLNREFYIKFDYDGYIAFMEMFLGNNGIMFENMDKQIIDYFRLFPVFIANQKPLIKVVTNYKDI